jgi:hypothetical protein
VKALALALGLTALAMVICLGLFIHAVWYTFVLFMLVAQPLLLVAAGLFGWAVVRDLRQKGVL